VVEICACCSVAIPIVVVESVGLLFGRFVDEHNAWAGTGIVSGCYS